MKKKRLLQLLSGVLTAAILISGNGMAVAAQELNGTKQSEEIAVQSEATEAVEETTEQIKETQTKTDELRQEYSVGEIIPLLI